MTPNQLLQTNAEVLSALFNFMNILFVSNPTDLFMLNSIFDAIVPVIREDQKEADPQEKELQALSGQVEHQAKLLQSYKLKLQEKEAANEKGHTLKETQDRVSFCQDRLDQMKKEFEAKAQEFEDSRKKELTIELTQDQFNFLQTQFAMILNTDLIDKERRAKGVAGYANIQSIKQIADFLQIKGE